MADFTIAYRKTVLGNEGGYNPGIGENETYMGIDRAMNKHWSGWQIIDHIKAAMPGVSVARMNMLLNTNAQLQSNIATFYKVNYWDTMRLDDINDQQVANNLFDGSVNPCIEPAAKVFQMACNEVKQGCLKEDGVIGSASIACINSLDAKHVFDIINAIREGNYRQEVVINPHKKQWLPVWLKRLIEYV